MLIFLFLGIVNATDVDSNETLVKEHDSSITNDEIFLIEDTYSHKTDDEKLDENFKKFIDSLPNSSSFLHSYVCTLLILLQIYGDYLKVPNKITFYLFMWLWSMLYSVRGVTSSVLAGIRMAAPLREMAASFSLNRVQGLVSSS